MDANQIKAQYEGYRGWNDPAAILADFKATGGAGKGGPIQQPNQQAQQPQQQQVQQSYGGDVNQTAQQMVGMQQEAVKPAIQALEAQKAPLQARYDAIIQSLKSKEQVETTAQQTALSQEYGKRGIPLSSGAFQQDLLGKTNQISQYYGGLEQQTGIEGQNALMDLASRIATLQSGAGQTGIQQALTLAEQQRLASQSAQELALKKLLYQQTTLPESLATVEKTKAETAKTLRDLRIQSGWE